MRSGNSGWLGSCNVQRASEASQLRISADGETSCPSRVGPSTLYAKVVQIRRCSRFNIYARDTRHASQATSGINQPAIMSARPCRNGRRYELQLVQPQLVFSVLRSTTAVK